MKESNYTGYYSVNPVDGSRVLHVPNLFIAYHFVADGKTHMRYCTRPKELACALELFFNNSLAIQNAIDHDLIEEFDISRRFTRQLEKLVNRGQTEKADKKIKGFVKAFFIDILFEEHEEMQEILGLDGESPQDDRNR